MRVGELSGARNLAIASMLAGAGALLALALWLTTPWRFLLAALGLLRDERTLQPLTVLVVGFGAGIAVFLRNRIRAFGFLRALIVGIGVLLGSIVGFFGSFFGSLVLIGTVASFAGWIPERSEFAIAFLSLSALIWLIVVVIGLIVSVKVALRLVS